MNLNSLEIFITVVDKGSFTEAARFLYISQPAVSKTINSLELDLNVRLFRRDRKNGLILTDIGHQILSLARMMKKLETQIYQSAQQENNLLQGIIRIASIPVLSTNVLSKAIALFKEKYPQVVIELIEGDAHWVKEQVSNHAVDIGLSLSPFDNLDNLPLIHDELVAISNTPLPKVINLLTDNETFIFGKSGQEVAIDYLKKNHAISYDSWFTVSRGETVVSMAQNGIGIGIISKYTLNTISNNLHSQNISPQIFLEYGVIANSLSDLTPAAREFISVIKESVLTNLAQH